MPKDRRVQDYPNLFPHELKYSKYMNSGWSPTGVWSNLGNYTINGKKYTGPTTQAAAGPNPWPIEFSRPNWMEYFEDAIPKGMEKWRVPDWLAKQAYEGNLQATNFYRPQTNRRGGRSGWGGEQLMYMTQSGRTQKGMDPSNFWTSPNAPVQTLSPWDVGAMNQSDDSHGSRDRPEREERDTPFKEGGLAKQMKKSKAKKGIQAYAAGGGVSANQSPLQMLQQLAASGNEDILKLLMGAMRGGAPEGLPRMGTAPKSQGEKDTVMEPSLTETKVMPKGALSDSAFGNKKKKNMQKFAGGGLTGKDALIWNPAKGLYESSEASKEEPVKSGLSAQDILDNLLGGAPMSKVWDKGQYRIPADYQEKIDKARTAAAEEATKKKKKSVNEVTVDFNEINPDDYSDVLDEYGGPEPAMAAVSPPEGGGSGVAEGYNLDDANDNFIDEEEEETEQSRIDKLIREYSNKLSKLEGDDDMSDVRSNAFMRAGLSMMNQPGKNFLGAVGAGALEGLNAWEKGKASKKQQKFNEKQALLRELEGKGRLITGERTADAQNKAADAKIAGAGGSSGALNSLNKFIRLANPEMSQAQAARVALDMYRKSKGVDPQDYFASMVQTLMKAPQADREEAVQEAAKITAIVYPGWKMGPTEVKSPMSKYVKKVK